ncbi:MAG: hypothetical protein IE889_04395, partial [Campylobacterales bacterium]|nr:hypothetical protein [Campylobacterales bacterium]
TTGDRKQAEEQYQKALAIAQKLVELDPTNAQWQMDLLKSHGKFGLFYRGEGQEAKALEEFMLCVPIFERILARFPDHYEWRVIANDVYSDIATSYKNLNDEVNAEAYRNKARKIAPNP